MPRTLARYPDFRTLEARGPSAATVIRLMMACNDLSLANQSLAAWKEEQQGARKARQKGAGLYFVRLQMAHLHEGLKIIRDIKNDPALMRVVRDCDVQTQDSFQELEKYLKGGSLRSQFEHLVGHMRNSLTFHYDEKLKLIPRSISKLAKSSDPIGSVTRGSTAYLWYFQAADRVVNNIVCFQLWGIPEAADTAAEADKKAMECHEIFLRFMDFAGEFIWKYSST
jgi:hypothetical protein